MFRALVLFICIFSFANCSELKPFLSADFTQTIRSDEQQISYKGKVFLDKSQQFFSYLSPERKRICLSGDFAVLIDDDLEQASYHKNELSLINVLKTATDLGGGRFSAQYENTTYFISADAAGNIKRIDYQDELNNQIAFTFSAANVQIDCNIPKDYEKINDDLL